jgi:hypothetical protein
MVGRGFRANGGAHEERVQESYWQCKSYLQATERGTVGC